MSDWHIGNPESQHYIARAHQDRADAVARAGYLLVAGLADTVRMVVRPLLTSTRAIVAVLRRWHERSHATRALLLLDDRMLKDIGLTRGEIWTAVHGALPERDIEAAPAQAPVQDIALSPHAIGGCNDNQRPRRVA